ncbi:Uncharacterised protein [Mycobacteroides abscessus subsp. abscessus]|nr:Uncharacterised protein [Mycobacteroides abscessus subsp. abscessus]
MVSRRPPRMRLACVLRLLAVVAARHRDCVCRLHRVAISSHILAHRLQGQVDSVAAQLAYLRTADSGASSLQIVSFAASATLATRLSSNVSGDDNPLPLQQPAREPLHVQIRNVPRQPLCRVDQQNIQNVLAVNVRSSNRLHLTSFKSRLAAYSRAVTPESAALATSFNILSSGNSTRRLRIDTGLALVATRQLTTARKHVHLLRPRHRWRQRTQHCRRELHVIAHNHIG